MGSFTIVTGEPNELVAPIHNRMPVILRPEDYGIWLGEKPADAEALNAACRSALPCIWRGLATDSGARRDSRCARTPYAVAIHLVIHGTPFTLDPSRRCGDA